MKAENILFGITLAIMLTSCYSEEQPSANTPSEQKNIQIREHVPFVELFNRKGSSFVQFAFTDYPSSKTQMHNFERNANGNTIMLTDKVGACLNDSYSVETQSGKAICHIKREARFFSTEMESLDGSSIKKSPQNLQDDNYSLELDVVQTPVDPISILRPASTECNPIPMCYYDDMEIEWNADTQNPTKVVIIAEWNGLLMDGSSVNTSIVNYVIEEDDGLAVLGDENVFMDIPDEALVNIWLVRANVVTIDYGGPVTMDDAITIVEEDPMKFNDCLEKNPEFIYDLVSTTLVYGAAAHLPIYLIRNIIELNEN